MTTDRRRASFASMALVAAAMTGQDRTGQAIDHITIEARDYSFRAPAVASPGLHAFRFVNRGAVAHELQFFRFKSNVSDVAARHYLAEGNVPDSAADPSGSVLIALAGVTAHEEVLVLLTRGERYALMCQFRDAAGKPRHTNLGMVALLEVR